MSENELENPVEAGEETQEEAIDFEAELKKSQNDLLLLRAEFENYRKRLQKTTEQRLKFAAQPLATDLLTV